MSFPYKQVDVFSAESFNGNPVAVFLEADTFSEDMMQRISNWMNLSETTFVLKPTHPDADYRVRIFDPAHEMPFAGHPTLGTAHAVLQSGLRPKKKEYLVQECQVGLVRIYFEDDGALFFELPSPKITSISHDDYAFIGQALNVDSTFIEAIYLVDVGPKWATVKLRSSEVVLELQPDMNSLAEYSIKADVEGVTVFGKYEEGNVAIEVRSFAPAVGVPEDPVCGSGNGSVAAIIKQENFPFGMNYLASQGKMLGRNGLVRVRYTEDRILIGGLVRTCLNGQVLI